MADEAKAKKLRRGHRRTVTRLLGQLRDELEAEGGPNIPKLRQQRSSLSAKLEVLLKLNE